MAIKKFDISEIDYEALIAKKFNNADYIDCVNTIRFVLSELDVEIDLVVVGIYLIKSYYNLGRYEEAFYEIKLLIALGANNLELSVIAMECMDKMDRLTTHKYFNYTNFDFINDNFDDDDDQEAEASDNLTIANSTEEEILYRKQFMSTTIIKDLESHNDQRSEDGFLSVVDKEESDTRLFAKIYQHLSLNEADDAIKIINKAMIKYPNDCRYIEHLLLAYDCAGQHEDIVVAARRLMDIKPQSAMGAHAYLEACEKCEIAVDKEYIHNYISNFKTDSEYDLFLILQSAIDFCNDFQLAQTVQDNNSQFSTSFYTMFVNAYIANKREGSDAAINIFKQMRAFFGRRCFADEYIELVKADKLTIMHALEMPKEAVLKAIVNLDLILRDETVNFSDIIAENPLVFENAKIVFYGDEPDVAHQILNKLDKDAIITLMWQLQELLLDDKLVTVQVKQVILYNLLSKVPKTVVFLGCHDIVEDIAPEEYLQIAEGDKSMEKAIILTMSKLYFKESAMSIRLKSSAQHIKKFKESTKLSNFKYLAELILVDCWYYGLEFESAEIAQESSLNEKTINKYLTSYDAFIGKIKFPTESEEFEGSQSIKGDIDEILGDFSSFIEKITSGSQETKSKLHLVKHNNKLITDDDDEDLQDK